MQKKTKQKKTTTTKQEHFMIIKRYRLTQTQNVLTKTDIKRAKYY